MDVYNTKKLIRSKSGLKIVTANEEFRSPFVLKEPSWVSDAEVANCTNCSAKFNFTTRKHHCRRCGRIFCNFCCKSKLGLPRMCFVDPVRICSKCEPRTVTENAFFDKHLKLLLNGAIFYLGECSGDKKKLLQCKISADHRFLLFEGISIPPIDITLIQSLQLKSDPSTGLKSLLIEHEVGGVTKSLCLDAASGPLLETTSFNWMTALLRAYQLMNENPPPEPS